MRRLSGSTTMKPTGRIPLLSSEWVCGKERVSRCPKFAQNHDPKECLLEVILFADQNFKQQRLKVDSD